jgi:hypothetical protein
MMKCGRDDQDCLDSNRRTFAVGSSVKGWYERLHPSNIRYTDPEESWEISGGMIAVLFFVSLFTLLFGVFALLAIFGACEQR